MNFNAILPNLGVPSNCHKCGESWYGLHKSDGICPKCIEGKQVIQTKEQKEKNDKLKLTQYLLGHKWRITDGTAEMA